MFSSETIRQHRFWLHRSWLRFFAFGARIVLGVLLGSALFLTGVTVISAIGRRNEAHVAPDRGKAAGGALLAGTSVPENAGRPVQTEISHPASTRTYSGVISDDHCAARHDMNSGKNPSECTQACVRRGAHYLLVNGDRSYRLEGNPDQLATFSGIRVTLTGSLSGNRINVSSIAGE
jgi:hypothetical protein